MPEEAMIVRFSGDVGSATAGIKEVSLKLKEQQAVLTQLRYEYSKLSLEQRRSAFGKEMAADIRIASGEIQKLKATSTSSFGAIGTGATKALSGLRSIAYILPGIGIAGIFNLAFEGLEKLFSGLDSAPNHFRNFLSAFEGAKSKFVDAASSVFLLREEINLAKDGFISKESVVKHYNETIGKTTGIVKSLNEAEKELTQNADAYIEMTLQKAIAETAASKAAEQLFKAAELRLNLQKALSSGPFSLPGLKDVITDKFVRDILRARASAEDFKNIMKDALRDASQFKFNIFNDTKEVNIKPKKVKVPDLNYLELNVRELRIKAKETAKSLIPPPPPGGRPLIIDKSYIDTENKARAEGFARQRQEAQKLADTISGSLAPAFSNMYGAILEGKDPIKAMFQTLIQSVQQLIQQLIQAAIRALVLKIIASFGTGGTSNLLSIASGFNFTPHASGGAVAANRPIKVGETGTELFVPSTAGRIIPNNQLGSLQGSAQPVVNFYGNLSVSGNELQLLLNRTQKYQYRNV